MSDGGSMPRESWLERLKYAFGIGFTEPGLTDREKSALRGVGDMVVARRLEVPAMIALESLRPLNFLGSQAMVALKPFVGIIADEIAFTSVQAAFEKRSSVDYLIEYVEGRLNDRQLLVKAGIRKNTETERGVDGEE